MIDEPSLGCSALHIHRVLRLVNLNFVSALPTPDRGHLCQLHNTLPTRSSFIAH